MYKHEVLKTLKEEFIKRFGHLEVKLKNEIPIYQGFETGTAYLSRIRWNGKYFEWYKEFWDYGWEDDQDVFYSYAIEALSDCLNVKIETEIKYNIEEND